MIVYTGFVECGLLEASFSLLGEPFLPETHVAKPPKMLLIRALRVSGNEARY